MIFHEACYTCSMDTGFDRRCELVHDRFFSRPSCLALFHRRGGGLEGRGGHCCEARVSSGLKKGNGSYRGGGGTPDGCGGTWSSIKNRCLL